MGRKSKSNIRKPEILAHMYQVLAEEGLTGTTLDKIARHMGVNSGLLIHYFKNKQGMMIALVDYIFEKYEQAYLARLYEKDNSKDRLEFLLDTLWGKGWKEMINQNVFFACYYLSLSDETIRDKFKSAYRHLQTIISQEIEACVRDDIIRKVDPVRIADLLIVQVEGLLFYQNIHREDPLYEEIGRDLKDITWQMLQKE